jgi:uncharacterized protein YunC (DUF1805 family)
MAILMSICSLHYSKVPDPIRISIWSASKIALASKVRSLQAVCASQIGRLDVPGASGTYNMIQDKVHLTKKQADGFVIPLGSVNLVNVVTDEGMVGCGAFDVAALDKFGYPAARVKPSRGDSIATIDDLLTGVIKDANAAAVKKGIKVGMSGREALDLL